MDYSSYSTQTSENLDNYILEVWGSFDSFNDDVREGDFINLPIDCIVPRSRIEFDNAEASDSYTNAEIELTKSNFGSGKESSAAELRVFDGHNRLKTAIANGLTKVRCKVV